MIKFLLLPRATPGLNWRHAAAFGLIVASLVLGALKQDIVAGIPITWSLLAGLGGGIWLAFQQTILPDILGGGGSSSASKGQSSNAPASKPPAVNRAALPALGALAIVALLGTIAFAPMSNRPVQVVQTEGCAWWNSSGGGAVIQQAEATGACELAQILANGGVTVQGLLACTGGVVQNLFQDLQSLVEYFLSGLADGAAPAASGMVCAAPNAKPPYAGAPSCIPASALAVLQGRHAEVKARLAMGDGGGR